MKTLLLSIKTQIAGIISIILAFLIPIHGLVLAVGLCIAADTSMGIIKAKKLGGWKAISSRKLSEIISKMFLYQGALILFFVIDKFVLGEFIALFVGVPLFLTKIVSATLCFIELKSIDENYKIIFGKSIWNSFRIMLTRSQELKENITKIK